MKVSELADKLVSQSVEKVNQLAADLREKYSITSRTFVKKEYQMINCSHRMSRQERRKKEREQAKLKKRKL